MSRPKRVLSISIVVVFLCLFFAAMIWADGWGDVNNDGRSPVQEEPDGSVLEVHFIDVGQGDAVLIRTPQGRVALIDAGTGSAGEAVLGYLVERGISQIDLVVGTHPHEDHIGGLIAILENLPVGKVIDSGKIHTSQTYERYLTLIDQKEIPFQIGRAGQKIALDPSITMKILHPGPDVESGDANHASVIIQLGYGQVDFLFTGDAEKEAEAEMLKRGYQRAAVTILKVGHHGSSSSTSEKFLKAIAPDIAVISVGRDNPYGHPHEETLGRLDEAGVRIYRTDLMGSIKITTDGISHAVDIVSNLSGSGLPYDHGEGVS